MDDLKNRFNQADVPLTLASDRLSYILKDGKKYHRVHDLIDIDIPIETMPELLLSPRVIKPLWGVNPRSILTQIDKDWWDRVRKYVYEVNGRHCSCCGVHQSQQKGWVRNQLDAHELYAIDYTTGKVTLKAIVPLCKFCHNGIHCGRLTAQRDSGKIQEKTFYSIVSHCNSILKNANLPRKDWDVSVNDNIYNIAWNDWYLSLEIDGKEQKFYSLYKDEAECDAAYS